MSDTASPLCAVLDLGSNSFHLLIGRVDDERIVTVDRRRDMVRLAEGLSDDGLLDDTVMQRALDSLAVFAQQLRELDPARVRVVATNTLRAAKNADRFLLQAERLIGYPVDVISGLEEGRLIFLGVAKAFASRDVKRLVIDIGGGSTELIVGKRRARRIDSLFMGCVSYSERFFPKEGKVSGGRYRRALTAARTELAHLAGDYGRRHWDEAIGSSGTIRNVGAVIDRLFPCGHVITLAGIEQVAEAIQGSRRRDLPGLSENRAPVFPGGLAILHAAFLELGIAELHVSDYALKEGVLYELAARGAHEDTRRKTIEYLVRQYHIDRRQAGRVERFALKLMPMVSTRLKTAADEAVELLVAAARLHEMGLAVSHSGYHKHGAYLLLNADMQGFSTREQKLLSFLVLNHRRKLREPEASYRFEPDWALVLVLRLACLFNRGRLSCDHPVPRLMADSGTWRLEVAPDWLETHPLVREDLLLEAAYWRDLGYRFFINDQYCDGGGYDEDDG